MLTGIAKMMPLANSTKYQERYVYLFRREPLFIVVRTLSQMEYARKEAR